MHDITAADIPAPERGKRILALDVMRGMTIALMIVVNNSGGPESYIQLQHSVWNGMTLCDLVFPFFLFIMGVTTYLSLSKNGFKREGKTIVKIFRRTVSILLVCWLLHWFDNVCAGKGWLDFTSLRLTGVLTRIALCYCIMSLMALYMSRKAIVIAGIILLVVYGALLLLFNGYNNDLTNVNAVVDRWLLPEGNLYTKKAIDPEGLLATLSAVAHTIIGFCCGWLIKRKVSLDSRLLDLFVCGVMLICVGLLVSVGLPINKRIWSPSYVLVSCGIACALLATLSYFIDLHGYRKSFTFFETFGVNPLFLYVLAEAFGTAAGYSGITDVVYEGINTLIPSPCFASLVYSLLLLMVMAAIAYPLYRKRIYIKL